MAWLLLYCRNKDGGSWERPFGDASCDAGYISLRSLKIRTEYMEGDQKHLKEPKCSVGEKMNPRPIQEYEFFVHGDSGETKAAPPKDRSAKEIKGKSGEQSKSGIFFSSVDETDA